MSICQKYWKEYDYVEQHFGLVNAGSMFGHSILISKTVYLPIVQYVYIQPLPPRGVTLSRVCVRRGNPSTRVHEACGQDPTIIRLRE
jgi:hypothetical protein